MTSTKTHYKTVFLSDLHIATKACKINELQDFLSSFTCDSLYLVGDIIDGWAIAKGNSHFPQKHVNAIRKLLSKAKNGTKIYYVIGNHDEFLRKFNDMFSTIGNIYISDEFLFLSLKGQKFLVTHGDMYDTVTRYHAWIAHIGDTLYNFLVELNSLLNWARAKFGYGYWSLSGFLKNKVKTALEFVFSFEKSLAHECKKRKFDGVIAGHIHVASDKMIDDVRYLNCGDGVESCTAIVETLDGIIKVINWSELVKTDK